RPELRLAFLTRGFGDKILQMSVTCCQFLVDQDRACLSSDFDGIGEVVRSIGTLAERFGGSIIGIAIVVSVFGNRNSLIGVIVVYIVGHGNASVFNDRENERVSFVGRISSNHLQIR